MNENQFLDPEVHEFFKQLAAAYERELEEFRQNGGMFILNPGQYRKFVKAVKILEEMAAEGQGGTVEIDLNPIEINGWATVEVSTIDAYGEGLKRFKELLDCVDVLGIEPTMNDTVLVDINVNNVWRRVWRLNP